MKKVIRSAALICLVLVMSFTMLPSVSAASTSQNKASVYSFLRNTLGFNHAAACGILANVEKESNFNPASVARDSNGKLSGGLFQWNGSRFSNLINYCKKHGYSYLSVSGQMQYLKSELNSSSGYKTILKYMKSVSNSAAGAYNAGYYWCYNFERPANKSARSAERGNLAKKYYSNYKSSGSTSETTTTQTVTLNAPKVSVSSKIDIMSKINLSWTSGGSNCSGYIVQIAKKSSGAYSWSTASSAYTTSRSYSMSAYDLGTGSYAVKVMARSSNGTSKSGSIDYFTISCSYHAYTTRISKAATATATGTRIYTCKYCGHKVTQTVASGKSSVKSLGKPSVSVSLNSSTAVATVKCSGSSNADGYIISVGTYVLAYVKGTSGTCKIPDMYDGTNLKIVAFKTVGTKTIKSDTKTVTV